MTILKQSQRDSRPLAERRGGAEVLGSARSAKFPERGRDAGGSPDPNR